MLQYLLNKLAAMIVYPLNQAGGWGSMQVIADPKTKTVYIDSKEYGCSYNAPYFEGNYQLYFEFLESKGWTILYQEVYVETKWRMQEEGAVSLF